MYLPPKDQPANRTNWLKKLHRYKKEEVGILCSREENEPRVTCIQNTYSTRSNEISWLYSLCETGLDLSEGRIHSADMMTELFYGRTLQDWYVLWSRGTSLRKNDRKWGRSRRRNPGRNEVVEDKKRQNPQADVSAIKINFGRTSKKYTVESKTLF